ncbi:alpha/beta hydrolase [Solihabitans fulvus]|uniref:Alpha/beta hydrolase n=1 Tax=Solihabitans fulvus TaxID=1892852 RepID=A0A5B2WLR6_9PSEU|nr:alpha/beta hydrolase [Solihabitans fulvus]KAA2252355.1 alpha/beta hydrolase [Solihabitans fulvus]
MARLHTRTWGSGARLAVLVHGMTTDSGSWWNTGPMLAEHGYRVIAPDLPGHGHSDHHDRNDYTLTGMADALLDTIPETPDLIIGHSLGGLVASAVVERVHPARAVFEDPPWGTPPGPDVVEFIIRQRSWTVEQLAKFHPRWPAEAIREKHKALALWDPNTTQVAGEYPGPRAVPPAVASLVLVGDTQPMIDTTLAEQLRSEGYDLSIVTDAGHNIHNDNPDAFSAALHDWF